MNMLKNEDYFTLKAVVDGILNYFCNGVDFDYEILNKSCMHPTRSAKISVCGNEVAYLGQVHPEIIAKMDTDKPVYACEIYWTELKKYFNDKIIFKPISKYPTVERDLAILLDADIPCAKIIKTIKENGGEYLSETKLFDVYQGEQVANGKKSMAFNLIFISYDMTLNVEVIDDAIKNILKTLREEFKAELR